MLIKNIQKPEQFDTWFKKKLKNILQIKRKSENANVDMIDYDNLASKIDFCFLNQKTNDNLYHKNTAKDEVIKILGTDEYIIPTYQICKRDEINYDNLIGKSFVIKPSYGCDAKHIIIQKTNLKNKDITQLQNKVKIEYSPNSKIVIEKFIGSKSSKKENPTDWKFWCFNGKPTILLVVNDRKNGHHSSAFFDMSLKKLNMKRKNIATNDNIKIRKPKNFEKMVEIASKISQGIPVIRIDLYNINGKIYFGECQSIYGFHCKFTDCFKNRELSPLFDLSNVPDDVLNIENRKYEVKISQNTKESKELLNANDENFEFCFAKSELPLYYKTGDKDFIYKKNGFWYKQENFVDKDGKRICNNKIYNKRTKTFEPLMTSTASKILDNILTTRVEYKYDECGDIVYYNKYDDSVCVKYVNGEWIKNEYDTIKVKKASSQAQICDEEKQKWVDNKDNVLQFNKIAG